MIRTFEELPDEILLIICRYLSSIDILSAFYNLNARLSQTISGYYQYISIGQASYHRWTHIWPSILPNIGLNIHSLIVSDEWQGLLSKVFVEYFGERMSSIFPHLEHLRLIGFTPNSLKIFLNCLTNLLKLTELEIRLVREPFKDQNESSLLLHQLFTVNNNRLTSITFDDDSTSFFCTIEDANESYSNIEKLTIKLKTLEDFHNLLTTLPKIHSLDVNIEKSDFEISDDQQFLPVVELKIFRFRSLNYYWNLDELTTIIKRIPNVENLSIKITSDDDFRFIIGQEFFDQLSLLPLKTFNYLLFYFDTSIEKSTILSTWQQFRQELICFENDNTIGCILYTLPCIASQLTFFYRFIGIVANSQLINNYGQTFKSVVLLNFPSDIAETYIIITKCRRMKYLTITIDQHIESKNNQQKNLCKLPYLTSLKLLVMSSMIPKNFQTLIEVSPNLYDLTISFTTLISIFNDDSICQLLGQRITHLKIYFDSTNSELNTFPMSRLTSVFPNLIYLCFAKGYYSIDNVKPLILAIFNHLSMWNSLISLTMIDMDLMEETSAKGIQQWVSENISKYHHNSFLADYTDNTFRLWL